MSVQTCAGIIPFLLRHYYEILIGYKRLHVNSQGSRLSGLQVCTEVARSMENLFLFGPWSQNFFELFNQVYFRFFDILLLIRCVTVNPHFAEMS